MRDIRALNIWKEETKEKTTCKAFMQADIAELNLSVRSYNCLKRAGCGSVQDIFDLMDEEGQGLLKIRNLGIRSQKEILEKIKEVKETYGENHPEANGSEKKKAIIKPAKKIWDMEITEFHLSNHSLQKLSSCGIRQIKDLYATNPKSEPGWYAVRELFEKIPGAR